MANGGGGLNILRVVSACWHDLLSTERMALEAVCFFILGMLASLPNMPQDAKKHILTLRSMHLDQSMKSVQGSSQGTGSVAESSQMF